MLHKRLNLDYEDVSTLGLLQRAHDQVVKEHLVCGLEDCDVVWKALPDGVRIVAVKRLCYLNC